MSEDKLKHLEFIQNIITRMNSNSFQIKEWAVTIVSALLAIFASTKDGYFVLLGIFPTIMFWFLDAHYFTQERRFRGLYNDVAGVSEKPTQIKAFEMCTDLYTKGEYSYCDAFWSATVWKLYLSIVIVLGALFIYIKWFC
jgi:hypothetical protein